MSYFKQSVAAGYKIARDANLQDLATKLGCRLSSTSSELQKSLALATLTKPSTLISRQKAIMSLRKDMPVKLDKWNKQFIRLAEIEKDAIPFFKAGAKDKDSLENDAIAQLSFQDNILMPLNHVPWMIMAIALFKVWGVPAMTLLTPIIAWILPYILLKFVYALPISQQEYTTIIQGMWSGKMTVPNFMTPPAAPDLLTPRSIGQFIIFAFSFAQSMIQPIQNALHLRKTDSIILGLGTKMIEVRDIIRGFRAEAGDLNLTLTTALEEIDESDPRRAFILIKEQPQRLEIAFRDLAQLEIIWRMAQAEYTLHPVIFKRGNLILKDAVDISLKWSVPSTLEMSSETQTHTIITGPNGGGKSSFLRACLQSVILGHSFGVAPATAVMPRFRWIASGLQLRDTPGVYSMFETEVKFAADCIRSAKVGPGLILFDELFHSTNPPDGARSAEVFLKQLWAQTNTYSIVSTHVFPLVDAKPDNVQAICCPAVANPDGSIEYSYKAEPGICRVSSVHTVWDKFGLLKRVRQGTSKVSSSRRNKRNVG